MLPTFPRYDGLLPYQSVRASVNSAFVYDLRVRRGSAPVRRRTSMNRLVDMVRTKDRTQSLTTVVVISTIFVFITLTTTFFVAVVCCKRNAVFALNTRRHRHRGTGARRRHSNKSTCNESRCRQIVKSMFQFSNTFMRAAFLTSRHLNEIAVPFLFGRLGSSIHKYRRRVAQCPNSIYNKSPASLPQVAVSSSHRLETSRAQSLFFFNRSQTRHLQHVSRTVHTPFTTSRLRFSRQVAVSSTSPTRRSNKSTCSAGSGSRDCEHCEMEQWRYSATAINDTSEGEDGDSPIFDVEVLQPLSICYLSG